MTGSATLHPAVTQRRGAVVLSTLGIGQLDTGPGQCHLPQGEGVAGATHALTHHGHAHFGPSYATKFGADIQPVPVLGEALPRSQRQNALTASSVCHDVSSSESGKSM